MASVYITSYVAGSCGNFVKSLVERTVIPNTIPRIRVKPFRTNPQNSAHDQGLSDNSTNAATRGLPDLFQTFDKIRIRDPREDSFISTHYFNAGQARARFPNARLSVITHTEADLEEIAINWLHKYLPITTNGHVDRNHFIFSAPELWEDIANKPVSELTPQQELLCVKFFKGQIITHGYHLLESILDPDVVQLRYRDIQDNPDAVRLGIKNLTGFTMTPDAELAMEYYQTKQREFMTKTRERLGL